MGKIDMQAFLTESQIAGISNRRVTSKRLINDTGAG